VENGDTPYFLDSYPQLRGDFLLRFRTKHLWLGGTSDFYNWLHNCYKNISVLSIDDFGG
jgi:hypothetical protein